MRPSWIRTSFAAAATLLISTATLAAEPATTSSRTLLLELMLLIPIAGLALYLRYTKSRLGLSGKSKPQLECTNATRLADGAKAQIISYQGCSFLVLHCKNGSAQIVEIHQPSPSKLTSIAETKDRLCQV